MLLSPSESLGFVVCASVLILDALLGRFRVRHYFQVGFPLGGLRLAADVESVATRAKVMRNVKLFVCDLPCGTYGLRYGFLGNWLPSLTKGILRTAGPDKTVFSISLNWGATALLGTLILQLFDREHVVLWGLLLSFVVLLIWFQWSETINGLRNALR
jgi:hypothetical protein